MLFYLGVITEPPFLESNAFIFQFNSTVLPSGYDRYYWSGLLVYDILK